MSRVEGVINGQGTCKLSQELVLFGLLSTLTPQEGKAHLSKDFARSSHSTPFHSAKKYIPNHPLRFDMFAIYTYKNTRRP